MDLIAELDAEQVAALGKEIPDFKAGDTIRVGYKVTEGTRTRVQNYEGVCIARQNGIGHCRVVHGSQDFVWRGCGTCVPAAFDKHRQYHRCAPWPCPPRKAVLSSRTSRQVGPYRRG